MNFDISDDELVALLRRAVSVWFNNRDLLLFEELLRRWNRLKTEHKTRTGDTT